MNSSEQISPMNRLREQVRRYCENQRKLKKECKIDSLRFGLGEIQAVITELEKLSPKDVNGLCVRIKRKKHASPEDMFRLSCAFLQGEENIVAFMKNIGAINVLVKELTGHDSECQVKACETLCNLSLGDSVSCEKIILNTGSYLVTYMDSTDARLKTTSLWTISNVLATGGKGLQILLSLEIVSKLLNLYNTEKDDEILKDIIIALDLLASSNCLRPEDKNNLREHLITKPPIGTVGGYYLKIIFESLISEDFHLTDSDITYLINLCVQILSQIDDFSSTENIVKVLYSMRILSNLISIYIKAAGMLVTSSKSSNLCYSKVFNTLIQREIAVNEILWFIKNMMISENYDMQRYFQENRILQDLKVGRFSVPNCL